MTTDHDGSDRDIPYGPSFDTSIPWYLLTVIVSLSPITLSWLVRLIANLKPTVWDLFGKGDLLLIAVPVAVLGLASLQGRRLKEETVKSGLPATLTVLFALMIALQVAVFASGAVIEAVKPNPGVDHGLFVGVSIGLFLATIGLGIAAARTIRALAELDG